MEQDSGGRSSSGCNGVVGEKSSDRGNHRSIS